jgi:hypothetical protein
VNKAFGISWSAMPKYAECPSCADTERKEKTERFYIVCAGGVHRNIVAGHFIAFGKVCFKNACVRI